MYNRPIEHEYEDFPRGRIVYNITRDIFAIYIDRKLSNREHLNRIKNAFGIRGVNYEFLFDHHYQSKESIR